MEDIKHKDDEKKIINGYRTLLRASKPYIRHGSLKEIRKAFDYAMKAHGSVRRKSGEPYILHPIEVATICAREIGLGTKSIISALLHDVVEDTDITLEDISKEFGPKIAQIIDGLTKVSGLITDNESPQAENFKKILLTLSGDVRVILIKLADRLHNMRTLDALQPNKQLKIASETSFLYAPLAHRLGLHAVKSELEDLSLKYTEPDLYYLIKTELENSKANRARSIRLFSDPIRKRLKEQNLKFTIKGRLKSIYSISQKMKKQEIPFSQVYDVFAIRIIVDYDEKPNRDLEKIDCWKVYSIVSNLYSPNPSRLRDWISSPKFNGYESLHTTVMSKSGRWLEVQIRSRRMDDVAEKGFAAHWKYKSGQQVKTSSGLEDWLSKVRASLKNPEEEALEFLDNFKLNLFSDEIVAFTPKGDTIKLPKGATALDFAFEIHSDLGARCTGVKVNQKIEPLSYKIKNGDQLEVLSNRSQKPHEGWLSYVITHKAKSKIKSALTEGKRKAFKQGKEYLKLKLDANGINLDSYILDKLTKHFKCQSNIELYCQIGLDKIDKKNLTKAFKAFEAEKEAVKKPITKRKTIKEDQPKRINPKSNETLLIGDGSIDLEYALGKCCNPIPGDKIFGYISLKGGIKIHRTNCSNGPSLMAKNGTQILKAKWSIPTMEEIKYFPVGIKVKGIDNPGLVGTICEVISKQLKVNMRSIKFQAIDGAYQGSIVLEMQDVDHLSTLISTLQKISGVEEALRFEVDEELESSK